MAPADTARLTTPRRSLPFGGPQMLVLDTGVIYNDIIHRLRHPGRRGVLLRSARAGATMLLAADHVYDEVYDRLSGHERRGFSRSAVVGLFERDYLPHLRFVSMPVWPVSPRVARVGLADADDAPTAALAVLVAPCLVFAIDPHLVEAGFGRAEDWLTLTWQADELLGYDGALLAMGLIGRGVLRQSARAAQWFLTDLRPAEVAAGVALGLGIAVAAPRAAQSVTGAAERVAAHVARGAAATAGGVAELAAERARRTTHLSAASVLPDLEPTLVQRLARILAVEPRPVSVDAVSAMLGEPDTRVRHTLAGHAAFVHTGLGWQVGRRRLPRNRELPAGAGGRPPRR